MGLTNPLFAQSLAGGANSSGSDTVALPDTRQEKPSFIEMLDAVGKSFTRSIRSLAGNEHQDRVTWESNVSPRHTILTFVHATESLFYGDGSGADLITQTIPEGFSANSEEVKALKEVFNRLGEIPPIDLPGEGEVKETGISQFEAFPYGVDHQWIWEFLGESPTGKVVLKRSEGDDPEWRFTNETLSGAQALASSLQSIPPQYPSASDQRLVSRFFGPLFSDSPWWGWLVLIASIPAVFFSFRYTRRAVNAAGVRLEESVNPMVGSIFSSLATSAAIFVGTVVFTFGTSFIQFSESVSEMVWLLVRGVLLIAFVWMLFAITDLIAKIVRRHLIPKENEYGEMSATMIQQIVRAALSTIFVVFILQKVVGINIGALVTGLGVIGLALSLAGKETTQNLFGAVSIFANRPFVVGDWIKFNREIGEVVDVRTQATHIRLLSGEMLIVPNMQFISREVENLAMRKYLRREMIISLPYGTSPDKVDEAFEILDSILRSKEIVEKGRCNLQDRPPVITFKEFGEYSLELLVYYWYFIGEEGEMLQRNSERGWFSYLDHASLVNRTILSQFAEHSINFAFPTQTLHLESDGTRSNQQKKENYVEENRTPH
ncbi:MAG: mechanosensitive ion channel family protein [Verrucomicrobiales bacterium]|nr:mechanosensitive ion channel family protein [Verrucomicrobiales bacterium]